MRPFTRISLVFWISGALAFSGCTNRAPSLRMLDTRSGYGAAYDDEEVAIYQRARTQGESIGRPLGARIAKVYVYGHELPSQDYFWGGYISLIIHRDEIVFERPENSDDSVIEDAVPASSAAPLRKRPARHTLNMQAVKP